MAESFAQSQVTNLASLMRVSIYWGVPPVFRRFAPILTAFRGLSWL